jgi:hypothetical protein
VYVDVDVDVDVDANFFVNSLHTILSENNTNNLRIPQNRIYKKLTTQEVKLGKRKRVVNFPVEL